MKCSFGISNFLEDISSLSHSVVFLYFFALIAKEGFLISSCYSLELCIQMFISFLFSFAFRFSSFHSPITSWQIDGETMETVTDFIFLGSKISAGGGCSHEIKRCLLLGRKAMTNLDSTLKNWDITLLTKVCLVKAMVFPVVMVWMWELDYKKSWLLNIWCFSTVVLEKTLESPLDCKKIQLVHPKGDQSWIFIGRTDAEAPILWPADAKSQLIRKDPDARPWLRARGEGDDRGWDGWMASLTQCTWVWACSRSWQWTGKPGMLQSMRSLRVRHDWATELNWSEY